MSDARLAFCFGVHNHQPVGNFDHVLVEATERAYRPFLESVHARPEVRLTVHCTGHLLEWLRERASGTFDLLGALVGRGQVELLTGGFYEPILAILPDPDKLGQIGRLTDFLKTHFGVRPRGMWLAERVWEPHLPQTLRQAGVEYVLVDDSHFALAGLDTESLGGYYVTEEQGAIMRVFPINQRLRYLVPFDDVERTLEYLGERRGRVPSVTLVDDGEKFGGWPGTHARVYGEGWLDRFFDRLLSTDGIELSTFADVVDRRPATGRVYLPTASYGEMGEWAFPPAAARALATAKRALRPLAPADQLVKLLPGGFWRTFLTKYPEVADVYWKMIRLSWAIHHELGRRPDDQRLVAARALLWRGQANDAYWHGVFGGCYLPHLRRSVKQSLLEAERLLAQVTDQRRTVWSREDGNGDGREEVFVRTGELAVTVNPETGGTITELGYFPRGLDLADVFTRHPESYHDLVSEPVPSASVAKTIHSSPTSKQPGLEALLGFDPVRRASLMDYFFGPGAVIDAVAPWLSVESALARASFISSVEETPDGLAIRLTPAAGGPDGVCVDKRLVIRDATVEARYRLRSPSDRPLAGRWAVQWNLALTAGDAPGRYLSLPGRPSLGSAGRVQEVSHVTLVDEWIGVEARLSFGPAAELAWGPVETVSMSEGGFERIYQGTALLIVWPLEPDTRGECEVWTALSVAVS